MPIVINGGTLVENETGPGVANPLGTGQIAIAPGAILQVNNSNGGLLCTFSNSISIGNGSGGTATIQSIAGINAFSGSVAFAVGSSTPTLLLNNTQGTGNRVLTFSGAFSGTGNIVANCSNVAPISLTGMVNNTGTIANLSTGTGAVTISGNIGANVTGVAENGSSPLILSGVNTYSGPTMVSAGTLQLGNASGLGTGNLTVNAGLVDLAGYSPTITSLSGSTGVITNSSTSSSAALLMNQSISTTFGGTLQDGQGAGPVDERGWQSEPLGQQCL